MVHLHHLILLLCLLIVSSFSLSGCGILIGNVKPSDHKSDGYGVAELDRENPTVWKKLEAPQGTSDSDTSASEIPDASYQSKSNSSIISVNSACREGREGQKQTLHEFTRQLLLGMTDLDLHEEQETTVQTLPALQTTLRGKMSGEPVMLRSIVLQKRDCLYDLLYIARPDQFKTHEPDFTKFIASLRIK